MTPEAVSPEEVARSHADVHAGYELISYGEIGLPYYELRLRAQVLERKDLNPFAEFICRALALGISDTDAISPLLGLDHRVLDATVVDLVVKEQVAVGPDADTTLRLTPRGERILADAAEIQPVAAHLQVNYDGLMQEVVPPFGDYLLPRQLKELGIREIPLPARFQPELHRLDLREVERVVRQVGGGRDQLRDILALKSMRRFRVFRPAIALFYRSLTSTDTLIDIALDGQRAERHSLAFAEAGLARKFGVEGEVARAEEQIAPVVGREVASILRNEDRNRKMREIKRRMRAAAGPGVVRAEEAATTQDDTERTQRRAEQARAVFDETPIKAIETFEHPEYLTDALRHSQKQLIIISPWLRREVINHAFLQKLEALLANGVRVYIGWGISKDERLEPNADRVVLRKLMALLERYETLLVRRLGNTHAKVLISDERYIIVTSFNWLSFRGDPKRTFRDERGTMISKPEYVRQQAAEWINRLEEVPES